MFKALDADGDGSVTRAEAEAGIAAHFAKIDANSDGYVTREEMQAHHEAQRAEMKARWEARKAEAGTPDRPPRGEGRGQRQMDPAKAGERKAKRAEKADERWAAIDTDGDGRLSLAEFTVSRIQAFDKLDADGDGVVTEAEFEASKAKMKERRGEWRGKKRPAPSE